MSVRRSKFIRSLWYATPVNLRYTLRRIYYLPSDLKDKFSGNSHKYIPPRGKIFTGSSVDAKKYLKEAQHQVDLLKKYTHLQPSDSILDVGSGLGRTAIALSEFLNQEGKYEGFDVVKKGVDWCNQGIGKDFANFNFTYVPLFNDLYNTSTNKADEFKFPYPESTFDKTYSFSVFTHMKLTEIDHYFNEIHRVLKSGGKSLNTFFLYDDSDSDYVSNREGFSFPVDRGNYKLMNEKVEGANIAIHKNEIHAMAQKHGLKVVEIIDGFWKHGREKSHSNEYQDIVVVEKLA
jgi:cyclopropane fatty-acyl-phospholipid synthase-like methyltransferase